MNLHSVCRSGNYKLASKLIEIDPLTINEINAVGYTPLHYACFYGYFDIVKLLYENEAELNITNLSGKTPFFLAVENNKIQIVKFLLLLADVSIPDKNGFTVLHSAIANGNFEMVKLLMSCNSNDEIWIDVEAKGLTIFGFCTPGDIGSKEFSILDYCNLYKRDEIKEYLFPSDRIIIREVF